VLHRVDGFSKPASVATEVQRTTLRRRMERCAILLAVALTAVTFYWAYGSGHEVSAWVLLVCSLCGYAAADLASGIVHWAADTYGSPSMPVFGSFVRTFREHHALPKAITTHDVIETNGDVCLFSLPLHAVLLVLVDAPPALAGMAGLFLGSYCNSQIHKWAHSERPPRAVAWLQSLRVILSPEHHGQHHSGPHLSHYCITVGWMNGLLDRTRFFRSVERVLAARASIVARAGEGSRGSCTRTSLHNSQLSSPLTPSPCSVASNQLVSRPIVGHDAEGGSRHES
jgi:ubiquitin-conjugating enzyme E2 variant